MLRKKSVLLYIMVCVLLFWSCGKNERKVVDQTGRQIKIKKELSRVICLSPAIAEWMYKLDLEDKIIARNSLCTYPEQINSKPNVGMVYLLDSNLIKSLNPDVVLSNTQLPKQWVQWFEDNDVDLILFKGGNKVKDIYPALELLGEVFNKQSEAEGFIRQYQTELDKLEKQIPKNKPRAYFAIRFFTGEGSGAPDMTANNSHLYGDIMYYAGLENIEANNAAKTMVRKDLLAKDPRYIILYEGNQEKFASKPIYQSLSAVKENRLIGVDKEKLYEQSPRLLEAIKDIKAQIQDENKE